MDELKILIVEDLPADAEIAKRSLKKEKISFISQVVDTAENFKKALAEFKPDLIISDYSMPWFDGMSALKIARSQPHYIPFILLTGSVNEETAVACMKAGADDYVLKEKVRRLPFAVNDALQKVEAQKEAEEKLRRHEEKLQSIFRVAPTGIGLTKNRILLEVNPEICEITGYQSQELIGKSARILYPSQKEFELVGKEKYGQIAKQGSGMVETRWQKKDGTILDILLASTAIDANDLSKGVIFTALDFSDRKKAGNELLEIKNRYQGLFENSVIGIGIATPEGKIIEVNNAFADMLGYKPAELKSIDVSSFYKNPDKRKSVVNQLKQKNSLTDFETKLIRRDGVVIDVLLNISLIKIEGKEFFQTSCQDITDRKQAEEALHQSEVKFRTLFESMAAGSCLDEIIYKNGKAVDYRILDVNPSYERIMGISREKAKGRLGSQVYGLPEAPFLDVLARVAETGEPARFEAFFEPIKRYLEFTVGRPAKGMFSTIFTDITDRKQAEEALHESEAKYRLLAETAFDLINFTSIQKIYEYTVRKLFELMEDNGIVAIVEFDTSCNCWKMKRLEGIHSNLDALVKITGFNVGKLEGEINTKYFDKLLSGNLEEIEWDFPEFFNNKVSGKIGKAVRKLLSIDKIYCILVRESEQIFGNITLITKKNAKPLNVELVEAFVRQVANYIRKLKAEEALLESEAKYRLLAQNSGDVIFTFDFGLNYTYISPAIYALRGYRPEEIINRNLLETLTPASGKKVKQLFEKYIPAIKSGNGSAKPLAVELEVLKKDGSAIWVEVKLSVLTDSKGKPTGILGVSRDISKRKSAQDELRKLSSAVTQSPDSIVITDSDGNIEYVNPKFTQITGYKKEDVLGENPRILKSGEHSKSFYEELWNTILSGNNWYGEMLNKKKNGELYWESASISPLANDEGEITHFVGVKEDITERKRFVEDLKTEKERAQAADRLKSAFLNNISHEVRTPLNGILGFSEMLAQPGINENDKASFLKILRKSSKRLTNTINDFMDISLIVSRNVEVNKKLFDLHEVIQTVYEQCVAEANEKGLELRLETGNSKISKIETDPELLKKILSHLLDNAIKFTKDGEIHFGYEFKNKQVEFVVHDNGTGIEQEKIDSIFDFFTQGEVGLTRGYEGSGLGLSISKGLVELLGGEISLQSEKGKGTTVSFTLPHAHEETEEETPGNSKQPAGSNLVLIAEDDSMNRLYLETILNKAGIRYVSVENGQQAVDKCHENPEIGIVLMDLKMPVMDGYEATRKIKSFKPELPVIAITAQAMQGDKEKALQAGCDDYISKPFKKENLLVKVNQNFS